MIKEQKIWNNFIAFEGIDASGKSSQIKRLEKALPLESYWFTTEPTDSRIGQLIRFYLQADNTITPQTLAYLFSADRQEHLFGKEGIQEKVNQGKTVITDRYLLSFYAYQGLENSIEFLQNISSDFPLPEYLIYLKIPIQTALDRMRVGKKLDFFEKSSILEKINHHYQVLLESYKKTSMKIHEIDGTQDPQTIHQEILKKLNIKI